MDAHHSTIICSNGRPSLHDYLFEWTPITPRLFVRMDTLEWIPTNPRFVEWTTYHVRMDAHHSTIICSSGRPSLHDNCLNGCPRLRRFAQFAHLSSIICLRYPSLHKNCSNGHTTIHFSWFDWSPTTLR